MRREHQAHGGPGRDRRNSAVDRPDRHGPRRRAGRSEHDPDDDRLDQPVLDGLGVGVGRSLGIADHADVALLSALGRRRRLGARTFSDRHAALIVRWRGGRRYGRELGRSRSVGYLEARPAASARQPG